MTVIERLTKVFSSAFAVDPEEVKKESVPDDIPRWDSIGHMNLIGELEQEFGVQFQVDEIMEMASVEMILKILEAKGVSD